MDERRKIFASSLIARFSSHNLLDLERHYAQRKSEEQQNTSEDGLRHVSSLTDEQSIRKRAPSTTELKDSDTERSQVA